jgi:hypothetical protein
MSIFEQIKIGSSFDAKGFKQAETATQKLNNSVKSLARTFGVAFGTAAVVAYGKASVKAFIEDDNAARSLGITLKNLGLETGNTSASLNEMISNLEKQTGVLDDQLRPAMDRLLRATNSVSKATSLLNLALDISAGTGKDLTTVSQGLQKAFLGNNASLGRLGVGLSKAELTSSSFEEIQIRLTELFAGQASSAAESYAGQLNKLTIAGNNAKEVIGKGIIQALTESSGSFNAAQSDIEKYSEAISDLIVEFGRFFRLSNAVPSIFELLTDPVTAIKNFNKVADEIDALRAKANAGAMGKNPIQSGSYLKNQKAITKLTQDQQKAQSKILADKKLSAAIDKANLALGKGTNIFDLDKIQIAAALTNQAEQLGKAENAAQILQIANDTARLNIKQSILALEEAIASKDQAAITAATNKLNADLKVLDALTGQNTQMAAIKSILEGLVPKDLIDQANLDEALRKIREMLALLAQIKTPTFTPTPTPTGPSITPRDLSTPTAVAKITAKLPASVTAADFFNSLTPEEKGQLGGYEPFVGAKIPTAPTMDFGPSGVGFGNNGSGRQVPVGVDITINTGVGDPNAIAEALDQYLQGAVDRGTLRIR